MKVSPRLMLMLVLHVVALASVTSLLSPSPSPSVVIVGAGMSGISAAKKLHSAGIKDFLILEATEKIGGRIRKTNFSGHTVEMGANWLHGVGGKVRNPLFEMANHIKLRRFFSNYGNVSSNTYMQEGGKYKKEVVDAAINKADDTEDFGSKLSNMLNSNGEDDMSILSMQKLHHSVPKTPLERMIDYYYYDGEQAESSRVTSLKHVLPFAEFEDFGENPYFVADPRGFVSLVHLLAKQFLTYQNDEVHDPQVKFNTVVREIEYTKSGVTVKTEKGDTYHAKLVIVSPSLGVLQSDLIRFMPKLPMWKRRAISEFSIGIYTKIFMKFPHKFWPTGNGTEFFFYVNERRGYYSIWQHLENEYPGSNILFVTVTDDESVRVEKQPDQETKAEAVEVLRKIFGKGIPEPTDILIPRWKSNRFFQGTFTNWPNGYSQLRHQQLRAPVARVYFTGEHTHPRYFGYASGAYFAGADTAKDVIKCLKRNVCKGDMHI